MLKVARHVLCLSVFLLLSCITQEIKVFGVEEVFPAQNAINVNPDTQLKLTFSGKPILGSSGKIRIYDASTNELVDSLDMSIPPGPTEPDRTRVPYTPEPYEYLPGKFTNANTVAGTPSGLAVATPDTFQLTIIGGFTDAFHFYPVIIRDKVATIYPHNNLLEYGKSYYVTIDPGVLQASDSSFQGISEKSIWKFSTKKAPPPANQRVLKVSADGTTDFNTVQGALDFIPDSISERRTIFIKNGFYEEIVYFRNKSNITIVGEDRDSVVVCYANNEVFNPHPANISTNEWPGTFPSRRAAFMGDNSRGIHLVNFTIRSVNDKPAQAEGLLLMGEENIIYNMIIEGSGDALQVNGSVYVENSQITGLGDNILGRGPGFFKNTRLISTGGPHMWIRNTEANHGNVFVECSFSTLGDIETVIARTSSNKGKGYPHCEAVLINCALEGVRPEGWGVKGEETWNIHYWEFNSTNLIDGSPADVSKRHQVSRQLSMPADSAIINNYSNPTYVLGGWTPQMAPLILSQPEAQHAEAGQTVTLGIEAAAVPQAEFQWYKDGQMLEGATNDKLTFDSLSAENAGEYHVVAKNSMGRSSSLKTSIHIKKN